LEAVSAIEESEERIRDAVGNGTRLEVARKQLGYHTLQARQHE
jgi:hypothetical protein